MKYIKRKCINEGYFPNLSKPSSEQNSEERLANAAGNSIKTKILNYLKYLFNEYSIFNCNEKSRACEIFDVPKVSYQSLFISGIENVFIPELSPYKRRKKVRTAETVIKDIAISTNNKGVTDIKVNICVKISDNNERPVVDFGCTSYNHLLHRRQINNEWKEALQFALQNEKQKYSYDKNKMICAEYLSNARVLIDKVYIDCPSTDFITHEDNVFQGAFGAYYDSNTNSWEYTSNEEYVALIGKKFIFLPNNKYTLLADVRTSMPEGSLPSKCRYMSLLKAAGCPDFGSELDKFVLDYVKNSDVLDDIDKTDIIKERKQYSKPGSSHNVTYDFYLHENITVTNGVGVSDGPGVDIVSMTLEHIGITIDCKKENGEYTLVSIYTKYGLEYDEHDFNSINFLEIIQNEKPELIKSILKFLNAAEKELYKNYFTNENYY